MNKNDRKKIDELKSQIEALLTQAEEIGNQIQDMADEERGKFDNLSEGLQASERGQAIEAAADALDSAASNLEMGELIEAISDIENLESGTGNALILIMN